MGNVVNALPMRTYNKSVGKRLSQVLNIRLFVSYQRRINIYGLKPLGKIVVLGTMRKIVNEFNSTELTCFSITSFFE